MSPTQNFGDLRYTPTTPLEADVLVIGSGAGGMTVAATAAEAGLSVLVLEEGPYIPASQAPARMAGSLAKQWRHGGLTVAYGSPHVSYAEGRCVGGSTEINSAIFQRTPEVLLADWATRYRIKDFSAETLAPYYDWVAKAVNANPTPKPLGPPSDILARGGNLMGWQVKELERGHRSCVGTNMCSYSCPTGSKQSMTASLMPRAVAAKARVVSDIKASRIVMNNRRAIGVEAIACDAHGTKHRVVARAPKIFICAGAIQTPALLRGAGLKKAVGKSLRIHPTVKCLALFDELIDAQNYRFPQYAITQFMPNWRMGGSVFTPATFGLALAEDWPGRKNLLGKIRHAAIYYAMVRGQGRGSIWAMPGGISPIVSYKLDERDWYGLSHGAAQLGQALLRAGATFVLPSIAGHPGWRTEKEAEAEIGRTIPRKSAQVMSIHLSGSCPIGENEEIAAADSFGRVHGTENLYIADAGVIPEAPGINPQATAMALSRRIAENSLLGKAA
jgi:choline dehydrogenase-like flavoprotein